VASLKSEQEAHLESKAHYSGDGFEGNDADAVEFIPEWGDLFVRSELSDMARPSLLADPQARKKMLEDLYDDLGEAYERNHLVSLVRKHKADVVIDSVNTATGVSYQNTFLTSDSLREQLQKDKPDDKLLREFAERSLLANGVPQIVRHVSFLSRVAKEVGVSTYLKIGTTGTGGMGLNIPYTHSEDAPSRLVLAKNEAAFGHSGLLFLWSITPGAPSVKELKPAAAIGYRGIATRSIRDRFGNESIRKPLLRNIASGDILDVREADGEYAPMAPYRTPLVDTGENGLFTKNEFLALTAPGSMELITPEEIAHVAMEELVGNGSGHDVLSTVKASILGPNYQAGVQRHHAEMLLTKLDESDTGDRTMPSASVGLLGPRTAKFIFEARILACVFDGSLKKLSEADPVQTAQLMQSECKKALSSADSVDLASDSVGSYCHVGPSVGIPVLLDNELVRGNNITTPGPHSLDDSAHAIKTQAQIDDYAATGWIDLRASNMEKWISRAKALRSHPSSKAADTSVFNDPLAYPYGDEISPHGLCAWIFASDGHR
jgi:hypothetical protein